MNTYIYTNIVRLDIHQVMIRYWIIIIIISLNVFKNDEKISITVSGTQYEMVEINVCYIWTDCHCLDCDFG